MVKSKIHGESDCTKTAYSLFANADKKKTPTSTSLKNTKTSYPNLITDQAKNLYRKYNNNDTNKSLLVNKKTTVSTKL